MSMIAKSYLETARQVLAHLEQPAQLEAIDRAADLCVASLQQAGTINCAEIGHGNQYDFINRAGGMVAIQHFSWSSHVNNPEPKCRKGKPRAPSADGSSAAFGDLASIRHAIRTSNLRPGDVMLVSSVSGKNRGPIELALACRDHGVKVIGLTSFAYTAKVESLHPCGKNLKDVVDVAIDNGAPYGDAAMRIPGYDIPLIPVSGFGMVSAGWMLWTTVLEKMAAAGTPASVLLSHNRDGGPVHNDTARERYQTQGY